MKIKVIVGLGNPGPSYVYTRHNIGFRVVDALAAQQGAEWRQAHELAYTSIDVHDQRILLIKPISGMNCAGVVVPSVKKKGIESSQMLVIHDELEQPFGKVAIKYGGSAKGHNGLRSLIQAWGSADFWKMKCGIGRPDHKEEVPHYVLSAFSEPKQEVEKLITMAQQQLYVFLAE